MSKLSPLWTARVVGDLPENVNFAIKSSLVREFLESRGIEYEHSNSGGARLENASIAERAGRSTVLVECAESKAVVAAGLAADSWTPCPSCPQDRLSGTIHRINKDTRTITLRRGDLQRQVVYDDNTKVTYRNQPGFWDYVREGRRVICLGKFNNNTQLMATRIDVRD